MASFEQVVKFENEKSRSVATACVGTDVGGSRSVATACACADATERVPDLSGIVVDPPQAQWNVSGARAVLKGAATLDGDWKAVEDATAAERAVMWFFKVEVVLP